jgi:glucosyl-3-phosphoglycerate synthase
MPLEDLGQGDRRSTTVSVCLPALNEEETIGPICEAIQAELMPKLVDELLVIDSGSLDATAEVARAAGARVHHVDDISPRVARGGKGEALWKSLAVARGEVVVWIDSDILNFGPDFVSRLVEPLLESPELVMTKGYYRRPLAIGDGTYTEEGGGRVTELALRPLLNLLAPELSGVIQPLSGEYAVRTEVARDLPFFSGYGVDIGILIDVVTCYGFNSLRQVDLGTRVHGNRSLRALGQTSFEVLAAFIAGVAGRGSISVHRPLGEMLCQFDSNHRAIVTHSEIREFPSWRSLETEMSEGELKGPVEESGPAEAVA